MSECYVLASKTHLYTYLREDFPYVIGWNRQRFTRDLAENGSFGQRFDSLAQMAVKIGADLETLSETVSLFNHEITRGIDSAFGRNIAHLVPLSAPWYLFACHTVAGVSLGGLKISPRMEVLDSQMQPIKGLYAIGEVTGGIHGDNFAGGSSLSSAATFGFYPANSFAGTNLLKQPQQEEKTMTMTLSRRKALQTAGTMGAATVFGIGSAMATAVVPKNGQ